MSPPITTEGTILQAGPAFVQSNIVLNKDDAMFTGKVYVVAVLTSSQLGLFGELHPDLGDPPKSWWNHLVHITCHDPKLLGHR